ncbi:helix-turn-helix domain containing protein [Tsukamurella sp. 8F]|uniref:TetR/AcrR family transcriptional regulator n=1 Tax=unclassified Tsukamurella TaxID=2633480 RepID=UPI0023B9C576|nr:MULTISPECIES: TetR/AcrR family transcriptional regulator [unclassified Tsukamurella]MDF0532080.1 helix-turn-helix domain containing protein [Tsukamurella sp. 8J]MDF0589192.1 helix-turn-helix domain containing protein [Tsukamurella sp. 8F]
MAKLTREAIVAEAVSLADHGGLDAVSMRRIADALGAGVMSLYRHVPDKDTLLVEMATAVGRDFTYPDARLGDPDWRGRVRLAAEVDLELYLRHPWVLLAHAAPRVSASEPSVRCFDWLVEALVHLTGDVPAAADCALQVWSLIPGIAIGAVGAELLAPGSGGESGFLAGLCDNEFAARLPRMAELGARTELGEPRALLARAIDALCDGFVSRAGPRQDRA